MFFFDKDQLVNNIRKRYNDKGLIPEDLKKASEKVEGVDFKELKNIINNSFKDFPRITDIIAFANLFNCSLNELLGFEESTVVSIEEKVEPESDDIIELIGYLKVIKSDNEKFDAIKSIIKILSK